MSFEVKKTPLESFKSPEAVKSLATKWWLDCRLMMVKVIFVEGVYVGDVCIAVVREAVCHDVGVHVRAAYVVHKAVGHVEGVHVGDERVAVVHEAVCHDVGVHVHAADVVHKVRWSAYDRN